MFMGPRNWFQGMNSASLCSLAGRYDSPIPPRFLAPIDFLKIPALVFLIRIGIKGLCQGVTKRCRLSWLTNSALVYELKYGGRGEWLGLSQWVQLYTGAQVNFADLTPYLCNLWIMPTSDTQNYSTIYCIYMLYARVYVPSDLLSIACSYTLLYILSESQCLWKKEALYRLKVLADH